MSKIIIFLIIDISAIFGNTLLYKIKRKYHNYKTAYNHLKIKKD